MFHIQRLCLRGNNVVVVSGECPAVVTSADEYISLFFLRAAPHFQTKDTALPKHAAQP